MHTSPPEMTCLLLPICYENLFMSGHLSVRPFLSGAPLLTKVLDPPLINQFQLCPAPSSGLTPGN